MLAEWLDVGRSGLRLRKVRWCRLTSRPTEIRLSDYGNIPGRQTGRTRGPSDNLGHGCRQIGDGDDRPVKSLESNSTGSKSETDCPMLLE